jgi:hypothetical protein
MPMPDHDEQRSDAPLTVYVRENPSRPALSAAEQRAAIEDYCRRRGLQVVSERHG